MIRKRSFVNVRFRPKADIGKLCLKLARNRRKIGIFMATNQENFRAWYVDILAKLYPYREAGFAIMMIALPLLERYLRQKVGLAVQARLNDPFYDELIHLFPELIDPSTARQFWQVYRHGLLHEVTLSRQNRSGNQMPVGSLTHDIPGILREANGNISVNPVDFAKRVVQIIEDDFAKYEGTASAAELPSVKQHAPGVEKSTVPFVLSTNSKP